MLLPIYLLPMASPLISLRYKSKEMETLPSKLLVKIILTVQLSLLLISMAIKQVRLLTTVYQLRISLKENARNEETCTVSVQNMSHNINLVRIGKWRRLNRISHFFDTAT